MKKNIAVLTGGDSSEREISTQSAEVVFKSLDKSIYTPYLIEIHKDRWTVKINEKSLNINKLDFSIKLNQSTIKFDCVFIAIHGTPAEDGILAQYFEKLKIPYTSSNPSSSCLTFNKWKCNTFLQKAGINSSKGILIKKGSNFNVDKIIAITKLPCFVKPNNGGSSFGISKVKIKDELISAIKKAFVYDNEIVIESFLDGLEVTCGLYNFNNQLSTFPLTEIVSENDFFDYEAKYKGKSKEITPARINEKLKNQTQKIAKKVYKILNLKGLVRIDFIITKNIPFIIEINTIPGLSSESIVPKMAKEIDMSLQELFGNIIKYTISK